MSTQPKRLRNNPVEKDVARQMKIRNASRLTPPTLSTSIESDINFLGDLLLFNQLFLISTVVQGTRAIENIFNPPDTEVERAARNYEYFKIEEQLGSALAESGYHPHQYAYLLDSPEFSKGKDWYINTFIKNPDLQLLSPSPNPKTSYGVSDIDYSGVNPLPKQNKNIFDIKNK